MSGALALAALALMAMSGCGGSSSGSTSAATTATSAAGATGAQAKSTASAPQTASSGAKTASGAKGNGLGAIAVSSPAFKEGSPIQSRYTCDGADISPPLEWSAIPKGTAEVAIFIIAFEAKSPIAWAVTGLSPTLTSIAAGAPPSSAIVGRNGSGKVGYTLCPAKGSGVQHYFVEVYSLKQRIPASPGFAGEAMFTKISDAAQHSGLTGFSYQR